MKSCEQLVLLKEYGLSDKLAYSDPGGEVVKSGDSYEARTIEITIKGSTLKSLKDVITNFLAGKKMNRMDDIMLTQYQEVLGDNKDVIQLPSVISLEIATRAKSKLEEVKNRLRERTTMLNIIRLGMALSGEYPPGLTLEKNGWSYNELVIRTDRKIVEI